MAPTQPGAVVDLILRDSFGLLLMVYGCLWANLVKSAAVSLTTPHTHTQKQVPQSLKFLAKLAATILWTRVSGRQ